MLVRLALVALVPATLLASAPVVRAQQAEINAIATQLAARFKSGHSGFVRRIAVPDCIGPELIATHLDAEIADELSDALKRADSKLQIFPREQLNALLLKNNLNASALDSEGGKAAFLKVTNNPAFVVCHWRVASDKVHIDVATYSHWVDWHGKKKSIAEGDGEFELTPEIKAAAAVRIEASSAPTLTALALPPVASPELNSLAADIANKLETQSLRLVQVVNCCDLGDRPDERNTIGVAFERALASEDSNLQVTPLFVVRFSWLSGSESESLESARFRKGLLKQSSSDALIVTQTAFDDGKATLSVVIYAKDGAEFAQVGKELSDLNAFTNPGLVASTDSEPEAHEAGKNGIGNPVCVSCPVPEPTVASLRHGTGGIVDLKIWIDENGDVVREQVLRGLPDGLTERALDEVRKWKFKPAVDSNGKPVMVFVEALMKFNLRKKL